MYEGFDRLLPRVGIQQSDLVRERAAIRIRWYPSRSKQRVWNRNLGDRSGIPAVDDLQTPLWIHVRDATTITTEDQSGLIGARC